MGCGSSCARGGRSVETQAGLHPSAAPAQSINPSGRPGDSHAPTPSTTHVTQPPVHAPTLQRPAPPEMAGVSLAFLLEFAEGVDPGLPTDSVMRDIIRPRTAAFGKRYADCPQLISPSHVAPPDFFVSHCWCNSFGLLVKAVSQHLAGAIPASVFLWIDLFAMNQHANAENGGGDLRDLMGNLERSVDICKGTIVVMDETGGPLVRVWCLLELWTTLKSKGPGSLHILTPGFSMRQVAGAFSQVDLNTARATVAADKALILGWIANDSSIAAQASSADGTKGAAEGGAPRIAWLNSTLRLLLLLDPLDFTADVEAGQQLPAEAGQQAPVEAGQQLHGVDLLRTPVGLRAQSSALTAVVPMHVQHVVAWLEGQSAAAAATRMQEERRKREEEAEEDEEGEDTEEDDEEEEGEEGGEGEEEQDGGSGSEGSGSADGSTSSAVPSDAAGIGSRQPTPPSSQTSEDCADDGSEGSVPIVVPRLLAILGPAGCGKTALAAALCRLPGLITAKHFVKAGDPSRLDPVRMIKSLAFQLADQIPELKTLDPFDIAKLASRDEAFSSLLATALEQLSRAREATAELGAEGGGGLGAAGAAGGIMEAETGTQGGGGLGAAGAAVVTMLVDGADEVPGRLGAADNCALALVAKVVELTGRGGGCVNLRVVVLARDTDEVRACLVSQLGATELRFGDAAGCSAAAGVGPSTDSTAVAAGDAGPPAPACLAALHAGQQALEQELLTGVAQLGQAGQEEQLREGVLTLLGVLGAAREPLALNVLQLLGLEPFLESLPGWGRLFFRRGYRVMARHRSLFAALQSAAELPAPAAPLAGNALAQLLTVQSSHRLLGQVLARVLTTYPSGSTSEQAGPPAATASSYLLRHMLPAYGLRHAVAHLCLAADSDSLQVLEGLVLDASFWQAAFTAGHGLGAVNDLLELLPQPASPGLADAARWLRSSSDFLSRHPRAVHQLAAGAPTRTAVARAAERRLLHAPAPVSCALGRAAGWGPAVAAVSADVKDGRRFCVRAVARYAPPAGAGADTTPGLVASVGDDHVLRLWDIATGVQLHLHPTHSGAGPSHVVCFFPCSAPQEGSDPPAPGVLVCVALDQSPVEMCVWAVSSGHLIARLTGPSARITCAAWAPPLLDASCRPGTRPTGSPPPALDGPLGLLAAGTASGSLWLWEAGGGWRARSRLRAPRAAGPLLALALTPSSLAALSSDGVRLWSRTPPPPPTLPHHAGAAHWDYSWQLQPLLLSAPAGTQLTAMHVSPTGDAVAAGAGSGGWCLWSDLKALEVSGALGSRGAAGAGGANPAPAGASDVSVGGVQPVAPTRLFRRSPQQGEAVERQCVTSLCFLAGGAVVAAGMESGSIELWDLHSRTLQPLAVLGGHSATVTSLAAEPHPSPSSSPDLAPAPHNLPAPGGSSLLVSGSEDASVRFWDVGPLLSPGSRAAGQQGPAPGSSSISQLGRVTRIPTPDREHNTFGYFAMQLAPGGRLVAATLAEDRSLWVQQSDPFSPGKRASGVVVVGAGSTCVQLLQRSGSPGSRPMVRALQTLAGHPAPVHSLAFSPLLLPPAGAALPLLLLLLAVGCEDGSVHLYGWEGRELPGSCDDTDAWFRAAVVPGTEGVVMSLVWACMDPQLVGEAGESSGSPKPTALLLAIGSGEGSVSTRQLRYRFTGHGCLGAGAAAAAASSGRTAAWSVELDGGTERQYRIKSSRTGRDDPVVCVALAPGARLLAAACPTDFCVRLLDLPSGRCLAALPAMQKVGGLRPSPEGVSRQAILPGGHSALRINSVHSLAFSADGTWLMAVAQKDHGLRLWQRRQQQGGSRPSSPALLGQGGGDAPGELLDEAAVGQGSVPQCPPATAQLPQGPQGPQRLQGPYVEVQGLIPAGGSGSEWQLRTVLAGVKSASFLSSPSHSPPHKDLAPAAGDPAMGAGAGAGAGGPCIVVHQLGCGVRVLQLPGSEDQEGGFWDGSLTTELRCLAEAFTTSALEEVAHAVLADDADRLWGGSHSEPAQSQPQGSVNPQAGVGPGSGVSSAAVAESPSEGCAGRSVLVLAPCGGLDVESFLMRV